MVRATVQASQAKARATRARSATEAAVATTDPIARVLVDVPLAHLDRPFDHQVPATMAETAVPGARVKVRFAARTSTGTSSPAPRPPSTTGCWPTCAGSSAPSPCSPPRSRRSPPTAQRAPAPARTRCASRSPPGDATAEKPPALAALFDARAAAEAGATTSREAFLRHLADGGAPRRLGRGAGTDWPHLLAHAAAAAYAGGRGALLCVPDGKDVARVDRALTALLGDGHHVALTADVGPARRYTDFLAVSRGARRVVVGTRAAGFAPCATWGYLGRRRRRPARRAARAVPPHPRDLLLRAEREETAVLVGGFACTVEAEYLLRTGWARELSAPGPCCANA